VHLLTTLSGATGVRSIWSSITSEATGLETSASVQMASAVFLKERDRFLSSGVPPNVWELAEPFGTGVFIHRIRRLPPGAHQEPSAAAAGSLDR